MSSIKPTQIFLITLMGCNLFTSCDTSKTADKKFPQTDAKSIKASKKDMPIFQKINPSASGITFNNDLIENKYFNSFNYDYFYNGGGVAAGDINNDGLMDLFFTGNMSSNKLYLNQGNLKFKDISKKAGIEAKDTWCTGVLFVDVNQDGFKDIYVCRSFPSGRKERLRNLLYINNGDLTFTEDAERYGLNDDGYSTHASFFDYDKDGDLDVFVANHPVNFHPENFKERYEYWQNPNLEESNRLYRNNGEGKFTDVTKEAGLLSYDFTLGLITSDINGDGLTDIYLSNDYELPDRYYVNQGNGTFKEQLQLSFRHTSNFSMGVDFADINNDTLLDLAAVDMVAEDNYRSKTMMPSMNPESFWTAVGVGYHYQYMRNMLQLNRGDKTFGDIGQMAGIAKTDWSWSVLMADFNLDGWNDIYVTNGYFRDTRNVDYRKFYEENYGEIQLSDAQIKEILKKIPRQKINNYYFENDQKLHFEKKSNASGIKDPSYSNGATYVDLDNDGDLELVVSNLGDPAFLYKNLSRENNLGNYLSVRLKGENKNTEAIGAKITIKHNGQYQRKELLISRGYQSGTSGRVHFGLSNTNMIDELWVDWPSGKRSKLKAVEPNQELIVEASKAKLLNIAPKKSFAKIFYDIRDRKGIAFNHYERPYDDYAKEILLPHKMSQLGPKISAGDINGDGLTDVYIGAAAGSPSSAYLQNSDGTFTEKRGPWINDVPKEDMGSALFDADGDGDQDLYVVSGSNEFKEESLNYLDRLYINDGKGNFSISKGKIPVMKSSGSCVVPADIDSDGDMDLFIGGRQIPRKYPYPASSTILINENGSFTDATKELLPDLIDLGMVSSAIWTDYDDDKDLDLMVVGEWMSIHLFENNNGVFENRSKQLGLDSTNGWWNIIVSADLDDDGRTDYVIGNLGKNYKYKASKDLPFPVYVNDFDQNGTQDIVLSYSYKGDYFPVRGRECSSQQMPNIKKKFPTYDAFGQANLMDIYGEGLKNALHYEVYDFSSIILQNTDQGFKIIPLPVEAQISAVQGIVVDDLDKDGIKDILIAGNLFVSEVETGRADAGTGLFLKGRGNFNYRSLSNYECGFFAPGDVRDMKLIQTVDNQKLVLVGNNNGSLQVIAVK